MDNKIIVENDKKKKKKIPFLQHYSLIKSVETKLYMVPQMAKDHAEAGVSIGEGVYKIVNCEKRDTLN